MQNTISDRIADFLKKYPPFSYLRMEELQTFAPEITIVYKEKDAIVFERDSAPHLFFYVVHKGAIELIRREDGIVLDICDEGDIFGLRPLMANENYRLEAKAQEESILYAIPITLFKPIIKQHVEIGSFLVESFASNTRNPYSNTHKGQLLGDTAQFNPNNSGSRLLDVQRVEYSSKITSCKPGTRIQTLAKKMSKKSIGAMLIEKEGLPIGIITDKDFRNKVVTGIVPITAKAKTIMSIPVITYPSNLTITQAQMAMMKSGISHLVLTEDGTPNTNAIGILSKHDVMLSLGNNPAVLVKATKRCKQVDELKPIRKGVMNLLKGYLEQNIPMSLTSKIISELNDACTKQVIRLSLKQMDTPPPIDFAWLAMGSQGRSEQLLHTDQDNALVFATVAENKLEETRAYFLRLAKLITQGLHEIGYAYCPADMMASNPKWCLSVDEFKETTTKWITNPGPDEVLLSSIFFDYNLAYGSKELTDELASHIFKTVESYPIFLTHLASGALQNPSPSGFFRKFLVEQDGVHKDFFDLKRRALMPLIDAARVLILSHHVKGINNTWQRYEKLALLEPNNAELYLACSYSSKALLKFRTRQGLLHNDSGRFISLEQLNKEERMKLKRTFSSVKDIQEVLSVRFMTAIVR